MKFNSKKKLDYKLKNANSLLRFPKDYPWIVLENLVNDLQQVMHEDDTALIRKIIRDRDFESYLILGDYWGLQGINSQCTYTLAEIRAKYQLVALLKKFRFPTDRQARVDSAKQKFKDAEDACGEFNRVGYLKLVANGEFSASILTEARKFLSKLLGETAPSKSIIVDGSRHGPGSTLGTRNGLVSTYHKYSDWPYTTTAAALPVARFLIQSDKRWLGALEDSYRERFSVPKYAILDQEAFWDNIFKVVPGNRITTVPKDALTERTIAIEPIMNLMLQLGVDRFIRRRLKRFGIDLNSQVKNQDLAYLGSILGVFITIDIRSASDLLALMLCRLLLPSEWYSYLVQLRSPVGEFGDDVFSYNKISSMGNGYTFALESAIFAAICYAAITVDKGFCEPQKDMSIFGDDIIVPKENAKSVVDALLICGFKLNQEKSFFSGPIRESCGCDWYEGKPIRPIFLSETPTTLQALFVDRNRLKRILELYWGLEETDTQKRFDSWVPEEFRCITGPYSDESFDSYLHDKGHKLVPFNYGCYEFIRIVTKPKRVDAPNFLFRKLMHNLRGADDDSDFLEKSQTVGGSRFIPTRRGAESMCASYSRTDFWCVSYLALKNPKKLF